LFVVLLLPLLWLGSLGIAPVHSAPVALNLQIWQGSPEWVTESLELTPAELDFFRPEVGTAVLKQQFETPDLKGSLLLVGSSTWRQQHAPELCWAAHGLRVEQMTAVQWPGLQARWLSLEQGSLSGFYWFQSAQGSTDNLLSRVGAQLRGGDPQWVLVSALIEGSHGPDQPEVQALVEQIQTQVQSVFAAESSS
jgi:exosortase O